LAVHSQIMAESKSYVLGKNSLKCPCEKSDIASYYSDEECLGIRCKSCKKEWSCLKLEESELYPLTTSREKINPKYVAGQIKPGDHIMWYRIPFEWHHAIVEDVNGTMLTLIHYKKETDSKVLVRTVTDAEKEQGTLYLITYSPEVKQYNPPKLVLARARDLIGMDGSTIIKKNGENFATFCKSGINTKQQPEWFNNRLEEIGADIGQKPDKDSTPYLEIGVDKMFDSTPSKSTPEFTDVISQVGIGAVIVYEGGICIWNLWRCYQNYKKKNMSRIEFIKEIVKQISKSFFSVTEAVGDAPTALGTVLCPGLGTVGGAVLGIIEGCAYIHRSFGMDIGKFVSLAIAKTIKTNDQAVTVQDLRPGDHIILYGNLFHPRCHAIFVEDCREKNMIKVIRRKYKSGIQEEDIGYQARDCLTIFRQSYLSSLETYSSEVIIKRAKKAVEDSNEGSTKYNILLNNCKHFVYGITLKNDSTLKHFPP